MNIHELETALQVTFRDKDLLIQAFTHSSYVNEHREENFVDNERLEFLGDAVLELAVSNYLFSAFKDMPEGKLTKLRASIVCEPSLYEFAKELQFGAYLLLGRGEEQSGGRDRPAILADVYEAFLGALYLDQGYDEVNSFLKRHVFPKIDAGAFSDGMDAKTKLQEFIQQNKNQKVTYKVIDELGPSHEKQFVVRVYLNNEPMGEGTGNSKKEAEQFAAELALDTLKKRK